MSSRVTRLWKSLWETLQTPRWARPQKKEFSCTLLRVFHSSCADPMSGPEKNGLGPTLVTLGFGCDNEAFLDLYRCWGREHLRAGRTSDAVLSKVRDGLQVGDKSRVNNIQTQTPYKLGPDIRLQIQTTNRSDPKYRESLEFSRENVSRGGLRWPGSGLARHQVESTNASRFFTQRIETAGVTGTNHIRREGKPLASHTDHICSASGRPEGEHTVINLHW